MAHKFEIYKDKAGEYRVRFKYNSESDVLDRGLFEQVLGPGRDRTRSRRMAPTLPSRTFPTSAEA